MKLRGPGGSVGIATGYGLGGPVIESRWRRDFPHLFHTSPGAHSASCTMGTGSFPWVKSGRGRDTDPSPPSSAVGYERVELYLYSPYGLYGLYRASVPVQWRNLLYSRAIPLLPLWAVRPVQSLSACTMVHFTLQ